MANITTRASKGAPLSWDEADANFTNLNNDKIEAASPSTLTNKTVNLTSNTLTGTKAQFDTACSDDNFAYVGQANTFTQTQTISSGNLNLTGTAQRITGDFSNATVANRLMFQTGTVDGNSTVGVLPNGAATTTAFRAFNSADPTNAAFFSHQITTTEALLAVDKNGTGAYLPMTFYTGGSERMRIDTGGQVTFNGLPNFVSDINLINGTDQYVYFDGALHLAKNGTGDRLVIDTNGYVGIGQPPARKLDVAGGARFIHDTESTQS